MKVYARFGEILSKTLKDLKETKRYRLMNGRKDGQHENSISSHKHSLGGYNEVIYIRTIGK